MNPIGLDRIESSVSTRAGHPSAAPELEWNPSRESSSAMSTNGSASMDGVARAFPLRNRSPRLVKSSRIRISVALAAAKWIGSAHTSSQLEGRLPLRSGVFRSFEPCACWPRPRAHQRLAGAGSIFMVTARASAPIGRYRASVDATISARLSIIRASPSTSSPRLECPLFHAASFSPQRERERDSVALRCSQFSTKTKKAFALKLRPRSS